MYGDMMEVRELRAMIWAVVTRLMAVVLAVGGGFAWPKVRYLRWPHQ